MPVTLTTLNNASAVAKTFNMLGRDKTTSEWINITDTDHRCTLSARQNLLPRNKTTGVQVRRTSVQTKASRLVTGTNPPRYEEVTVTLTIVRPDGTLEALTQGEVKDLVAFIRNHMDNSNVDAYALGMLPG